MVCHQKVSPALQVSMEGLRIDLCLEYLRRGPRLMDRPYEDLPDPLMIGRDDDLRLIFSILQKITR